MTNPDLQPGKPVQTRSGLEAVIYAVHERQKYPIIGAYKNENGNWVPFVACADGTIWGEHEPHDLDIIPGPKKLTGFINVYADYASKYETREEADRFARPSRIDCLDLSSLNLTEGHGLTEGSSDETS